MKEKNNEKIPNGFSCLINTAVDWNAPPKNEEERNGAEVAVEYEIIWIGLPITKKQPNI